ncbi:MAG: type II toxin-antitoxin system VapC family toxin [Chloroflexota bacterium]
MAEARALPFDLLAFPLVNINLPELHQQALEIADRYRLRATYDAHYVALAQALECEPWTDDLRLMRALDDGASPLRWIGDYQT